MTNPASWLLRTVVVVIVVSGFTGNALVQSQRPPAPVMNEELMARLIKRTLTSKQDSKINKEVAGILGLNDGSVDLPAKQIGIPTPEGKHTILVYTKEGSNKIVFAFMRGDVNEIYLVDETGGLRAASIWDTTGIRLITKEQAQEKYEAELVLFARKAAGLPPTTPDNN
jgi:hypothetical protein